MNLSPEVWLLLLHVFLCILDDFVILNFHEFSCSSRFKITRLGMMGTGNYKQFGVATG